MQLWWWGLLWIMYCKKSLLRMCMSPVWCWWTKYYKSIGWRWVLQWWDQQSQLQLWWWWLLWTLPEHRVLFWMYLSPRKFMLVHINIYNQTINILKWYFDKSGLIRTTKILVQILPVFFFNQVLLIWHI